MKNKTKVKSPDAHHFFFFSKLKFTHHQKGALTKCRVVVVTGPTFKAYPAKKEKKRNNLMADKNTAFTSI